MNKQHQPNNIYLKKTQNHKLDLLFNKKKKWLKTLIYMCLLEGDIGNLMIGLLIVSMKILELWVVPSHPTTT